MTSPAIAEPMLREDHPLSVQLQRRLGGRIRDLRALRRPDGIVLVGRAATYHAKQLAQHAAMELVSQPIVANDIEVC